MGLLAVAAIVFAYVRVGQADFNWDDDAHITANPTIVGPLGLKEIWTSGKANYFPLTMTSFWVQHALWGLAPGPYHLVTMLFHVGGALVLWRVLQRLELPGAWLGAMLWALHPVQVESVAWICELKNTQSGLFYLLAILFFLRWLQREGGPRFDREYVLSVFAAVLAILSKSSTVMLPVVLGLIGWWLGHRRWRDVRWLLPFLAVSLVAGAWTIWEQKVNSMASGPDWDHGLGVRLIIAGKVPWFYLGKLLWPDPLVFIYPRWDVKDLGFVRWLPLFATGAVVVALWWNRNGRGRPLFLALGYFGLSLFPVLGLFDVFFFRYSFVGDHFQYLASMGPMALIGVAVGSAFRREGGIIGWAVGGGGAVLLVVLGLLTRQQTSVYLNRETLWRDTVALNPRAWIAQVNLGSEYISTGRQAQAIPHFQAALGLKPDDQFAEANWGNSLIQMGRPAEAVPHLERAVKLMPRLAPAHNSLGLAFASMGRLAEAAGHYETALQIDPKYHSAHYNYGNCLLLQKQFARALDHYEKALSWVPDSAVCHARAGLALAALGRNGDALAHYVAAARLNPRDFDSLFAAMGLLAQSGQHESAVAFGREALQVRPDAVDCLHALGNALVAVGRPAEAVPFYERVLSLAPEHPDARFTLGVALLQSGRPADAVPHYVALLQRQPDSAEALNNLASALMQAGRLPEAIERYRTALQKAPGLLQARRNLALALESAGRPGDAIIQYGEILARIADDQSSLENLARLRKKSPAVQSPPK
jgi:tetratricopeptide (TPR) repeat protein